MAQSCLTLCDPWNHSMQASLSITNSRSPHKPMSIVAVMSSKHLILCRPLLLLPSVFPSIRVFSSESALCIRCPKCWSFCFTMALFSHPQRTVRALGFPGGRVVNSLPASAGDPTDRGFHPWVKKIPGVGNGNHSSILAWRIPGTEEPGGYSSRAQKEWIQWSTKQQPQQQRQF